MVLHAVDLSGGGEYMARHVAVESPAVCAVLYTNQVVRIEGAGGSVFELVAGRQGGTQGRTRTEIFQFLNISTQNFFLSNF